MPHKLHMKRRPCRQQSDGMTLIEMAVVMLVIVILAGVGLYYFGLIGTAHLSVSIQYLKGADIAANTLWGENSGAFPAVGNTTSAALNTIEPNTHFTYAATIPYEQNSISYNTGAGGESIVLQDYSPNNGGECIGLFDIKPGSSYNYTTRVAPGSTKKGGTTTTTTVPSNEFYAGTWWGETTASGTVAASGIVAPSNGSCDAGASEKWHHCIETNSNKKCTLYQWETITMPADTTGWSQTPPSS